MRRMVRETEQLFSSRRPLLVLAKGLELDILVVVSTFRDQLVVSAGFADAAFFDKVTA